MKKIEAILRPEQLEPLKEALLAAKVNGITINQVFGCGNQYGWTEYHRGSEVIMNTLPKVEFKIVVADDRLEEIVDIIINNSQTGEVGDGKIFISEITDCIRIRTKERGDAAI
ncbi:P-II family nitrogen regulator [Anaeromicropila herbilytica]|uniref:Nitrogen regulatory protein P-II n=1 Tax=Anaeromicropila herbilytica TaxID=2785025 RepID=A0A7R7IDK2_9FIRM|nr:P-II family nitrogen regulator [Anaeromicropila herbilytica]BCN31174.1 nitrogen regulatory protein P-II [Anaeromicropila herbilytica]